jgi:hypothetical protein
VKLKRLSLILFLLCALCVYFDKAQYRSVASLLFLNLGKWLIVSNPLPNHADIIFVFSGDYKRLDYALTLTRKYPNATLLCTSEDYAKRAHTKTVKEGRSINIQSFTPCSSTIDEIQHLRQYLEERMQNPVPSTHPSTIELRAGNSEARIKIQELKAC